MTQTPLLLAIIFLLVVLVLYIAAIKRIKKIQLELSDSNQKNEEYKSRFADYFNVEEECKKLIENNRARMLHNKRRIPKSKRKCQ